MVKQAIYQNKSVMMGVDINKSRVCHIVFVVLFEGPGVWLTVGALFVGIFSLDRSEMARAPKATAVGIAMFDIGAALVSLLETSLLETGLLHPPAYGLGGGMGPLVVGTKVSYLL